MALKAHVGFSLASAQDIGRRVIEHFSALGYRLAGETQNQWVLQRGNKLAVLWRFDIRAYETTLRVRAAPEAHGAIRVSCDWEVWTFMSITTAGDIATLEAEGRQLESALKERA